MRVRAIIVEDAAVKSQRCQQLIECGMKGRLQAVRAEQPPIVMKIRVERDVRRSQGVSVIEDGCEGSTSLYRGLEVLDVVDREDREGAVAPSRRKPPSP